MSSSPVTLKILVSLIVDANRTLAGSGVQGARGETSVAPIGGRKGP